jgi:hypothetical protein
MRCLLALVVMLIAAPALAFEGDLLKQMEQEQNR